MIDSIQKKADVILTPLVDCVEENSIDTRSTTSNDDDTQTRPITIALREDWASIIHHRSSPEEYKDFIRRDNFPSCFLEFVNGFFV